MEQLCDDLSSARSGYQSVPEDAGGAVDDMTTRPCWWHDANARVVETARSLVNKPPIKG